MKIEKILKQLTPERVKKEIEEVQEVRLPSGLQKWVKEYKKVGGREDFIWKWAYRVADIMSPFEVPKIYRKSLIETKFLMIMFIVLLDDVADKTKNKRLLDKILKVPFRESYIKINKLNKREKQYLKFTIELWQFIEKTFKKYPHYQRLKSIINYDICQILNGIKYAYLVNKNLYLTNEIEFQIYLSHNTPAILSYTIDSTCMPRFNMETLGLMRKIMWYVQAMARISNWVATWKREIKENDFASGIFCFIIENKIIKIQNLQKDKEKEIIKKINKSKAEEYLFKKWGEFYKKIINLFKKDKSVNGKEIFKLIKQLTILHLISRGFI